MLSLMQKIGRQKRDTWLKDRNCFWRLTHKKLFSEKDNFSLIFLFYIDIFVEKLTNKFLLKYFETK